MKELRVVMFFLFCSAMLGVGCKSTSNLDQQKLEYIDVTDYGISANSSRDQTDAIQKLFDNKRKNGKFFFPKGKYHISTLHIYEGIQISGEEHTWFIRLKNQGKWSRMFNTINYEYSGTEDSEVVKFSKINIDGNFENQGEYTRHQLEHQAMIFLVADRKLPGRLKVEIDSCNFINGVGDAIAVHYNVDARITNSQMTDVFRGGITVGGGHSKVYANNINIGGEIHKTGIDVEVDGRGRIIFMHMVETY